MKLTAIVQMGERRKNLNTTKWDVKKRKQHFLKQHHPNVSRTGYLWKRSNQQADKGSSIWRS